MLVSIKFVGPNRFWVKKIGGQNLWFKFSFVQFGIEKIESEKICVQGSKKYWVQKCWVKKYVKFKIVCDQFDLMAQRSWALKRFL